LAADETAWLIEDWMSRLASSVELMTEVRPGLKLGGSLTAGSADIPPDTTWHAVPLNVAAGAIVYLGASGDSWLHIGKSALLAAGVPDVTPEDARGTYLEIVTQATSGLAQAIAERLGKPVAALAGKQIRLGQDGLTDAAAVHPVEISLLEPPPRILYVGWSRELVSALTPAETAAPEHSEPDSASTVKGVHRGKSSTFDLLMEVELPVSVSFGRAHLPLRDVLKLNSGSIVELNRTISDPVEIIVNNCVIARGEVVVVEGNYGVRIQHVISREERLRTLK
jgi:flagellar motor switch protein FliN/FliY